jgi:subtilisin family serine protease
MWIGLTAHAQPTPQRYLIEFREFGPAAAALVRAQGGLPVHEFPAQRTIAAWLPEQGRLALANRPDIVRIERDAERYPLAQATPYGISMVQANDPAVAYSGATGAKVCIIDSGYDSNHPDLPGLIGIPPTGDSDSGVGDWSTDRCGHGTHVAGTIAALSNTTGVVGVFPGGNLPLHIVKVFDDSCNWAYSSDLVAALNKCTAANARVVSMSLGGALPTAFEEAAFNAAYSAGVLSIAAAGNGGNTAISYPAGYGSVMSVGAVDSTGTVAGFSQENSDVEIAAPGVSVLSTVPWTNENSVTVDGSTIFGTWMENAGRHEGVTGGLVNGGLCDLPGGWAGKVVLCERGNITFFQKVTNVQAGGGVATVVYNNIPGTFIGTLGDGNSSVIPAISLSQDEGQWLVAHKLNLSATVVSWTDDGTDGYEAWDGTSMATPHVSGVAALLWSHRPTWTNREIRAALQQTAVDLGAPGADPAYGFGLVQAKNAYLLAAPPPAPASVVLSGQGSKVKGRKQASLTWTGGPSLVSVFRSGVRIATAIKNNGGYVDAPPTKGNSFVYTICEAHGVNCSNSVVVTF